jgi:hypothetical protein
MFKEKMIPIFLMTNTLFYITGCQSKKIPENRVGYYYSGVYFGKEFSPNYQQGIMDGCITAKGTYKKSHTLFNNDQEYNDGWFLGRNRCKHLLVIEKENEGKSI